MPALLPKSPGFDQLWILTGPGGAFALVSLQLLVGTFFFLSVALVRYPVVNRGYFRSTALVLWTLLAAVAFLLESGLKPLGIATAILVGLFLAAVYSQRPLLEWMSAAAASSVGTILVYRAGLGEEAAAYAGLQAISGMLLLGGVTHAMVLGHWYLNQARLPIEPLKEQTLVVFAAIVISFMAGLVMRPQLVAKTVAGAILVASGSSYWWAWFLLLTGTAGLTAMVWATAKARSTQSATGLLYIAIVTALAAQFVLNLLSSP